jgi:prolyl oligopeptidase
VSVAAFATEEPGYRREFITRTIGGNSGLTFIRQDSGWRRIELPDGIEATPFRNDLIVLLRNTWRARGREYPAGSLLAIDLDRFMAGDRAFRYLFKPARQSTLLSYTTTQNRLLLNVLDNSRSRLHALTLGDYRVRRSSVPTQAHEAITVSAVDEFATDDYFLTTTGFLEPTALYLGKKRERELLYRLPEQFDVRGLQVTRHRAVSKDGTLIPYFMIARKDLPRDGSHPTLLTGYGGFEVARTPQYDGVVGAAWLERGGVYVVANVRGGGEFGPAWHQAALRERRQTAYDDFIGVAEDLIARKITAPRHLGVTGSSNGGLLVAAVAVQRPELFGAVVSSAPLLDMRRYSKLSAGASWLAEFGDPDRPEDWAYLRAYSPYHNVLSDKRYPPMLFITSLRDDRVHPAHARKMTALMQTQGHDVWYYESAEGGHASAGAAQQAYAHAMAYAFLLDRLK